MNMSKIAPFAIAAAFAWGSAANAAFTIYTSEAAFLAALTAAGTDSFDDLSVAATPGPLVRTAGSFGYTATVGPNSTDFFPGSDDGTDIFLSTNNRFDTITLTGFTGGANAVGGYFFGSDFLGFSTPATSITIIATDGDGASTQTLLAPTTGTYLGFISTGGLSSLDVLIGDEEGVWPSINDLTFGVSGAVPEPATWGLMIVGFGLVGTSLRRKVRLTA